MTNVANYIAATVTTADAAITDFVTATTAAYCDNAATAITADYDGSSERI